MYLVSVNIAGMQHWGTDLIMNLISDWKITVKYCNESLELYLAMCDHNYLNISTL